MMYSHQSSIDHTAHDPYRQTQRPALDLADFQTDKSAVDNEIFYLEREIFDYN